MNSIGLGDSWEALRQDRNIWLQRIESRLTDIHRQNIEAGREEKRSLILQRLLNDGWGRQKYIDQLGSKARSGLRVGGWKIRKFNSGTGAAVCIFCEDRRLGTYFTQL